MKSGLKALLAGAGFAVFGMLGFSQEGLPLRAVPEHNYEVSLEKSPFPMGEAHTGEDGAQFVLGSSDELVFERKGNYYFEISKSKAGKEVFTYRLGDDSRWTFVKYDFYARRKGGKTRLEERASEVGEKYSKDVLLVPDVIRLFEGPEIPRDFKVLLFSNPYEFVAREIRDEGGYVRVEYEPIDYKVYKEDKKYLVGNPVLYFKKESDGTYSPAQAKAELIYKLFGIKFRFKLDVSQVGEVSPSIVYGDRAVVENLK